MLYGHSLFFSVRVLPHQSGWVTRMTTGDGVANNSIRYIYQDSKGFIWMGTLNGLSRYDGNSFVTYRPEGEINFVDRPSDSRFGRR